MEYPIIFALEASRTKGEGIVGCLGAGVAEYEERPGGLAWFLNIAITEKIRIPGRSLGTTWTAARY
jgi:hypothetical protein